MDSQCVYVPRSEYNGFETLGAMISGDSSYWFQNECFSNKRAFESFFILFIECSREKSFSCIFDLMNYCFRIR